MGVLKQELKIFKKLFQLDLFESEPNREAFSHCVDDDIQRFIPKRIPLNALGMNEVIHQLQMNIVRLGPVITLILIDSLQQLVHSGLLLTLNKTLQLKRCLIQFMDHMQSGKFNGIYLQRLIEPMNSTKKVLLINQLNSLLQKIKLIDKNKQKGSRNNYDKLVSILMNLAYKGQLNTYSNVVIIDELQNMKMKEQRSLTTVCEQIDIENNNLQSLLFFLHEQSTAASPPGHLPTQHVIDFIKHLRHFAQLGILYQPQSLDILINLHKAKDKDYISVETLKTALEQIKIVNYVQAYNHLNLIEFDKFLNDMISDGNLTRGQALYILDRLIDLCRIEPITTYDIKTLLTNIQLEHNRQQSIYPKLIEFLQALAESYSSSLAELHSLEQDLQKLLSSNTIKRIPDEIRRRLNEIIFFCRKFRNNRLITEELFGERMNYKFYNQLKEILKTKTFLNRKQPLTAVIQIHKHFLQISRLNSQKFLSDFQLDLILQDKCSQQQQIFKHMAELGYLQDKSFVDYLTQHFLSNELSSWDMKKCMELETWLFTLDFNHPDVRVVVEHLKQLEIQDKIDTGTSIEIQNRLNQLARFGKWSSPQIKLIIDGILHHRGKSHLFDKDSFQLIQSYRLILNDITHAIEFEFHIQQLTSEHQLSDYLNYRFRHYLYRILQNELSIDELICYRLQLERFYHVKQMDLDQVKRFIELLSKQIENLFPLTLTDKLLERLKWDGKILEKSTRDQLLKLERSGVLSQDTFEEIYNNLYRTSDISFLSLKHTNQNQILSDLFDKINDLLHDNLIDLHQSIQMKEQLYLLEDMTHSVDLSQIITIESRLLNSTNQNEFHHISEELKNLINQEQFRLSRAQDLISTWHLNAEKGTSNEKQILKLINELATLNRLNNSSTSLLFNRYIEIKQVNQTVYRQLIKYLQRLKDHAVIDRQATECIRSIEVRIYKFDQRKRLNEGLIKTLENRLKQIFSILSRSFDQHLRLDICKKLTELIEIYVQSKSGENPSDELLNIFDSYVTQIKQGQLRPSRTQYHSITSDATVSKISPSLQSLQSI